MTWTRLSDDFTDQAKFLDVSRSARLLHVEALVWCNRLLTDGQLSAAALRRLTDADAPEADAEQLVRAGLWQLLDDASGWQVEWADQESSADVRERQQAQAAKQKRYRRRKSLHDRGDHTECDPRYCRGATRNVTGHDHRNVTRLVTPSRPDPSRPKGRDRDQEADGTSAGAPAADGSNANPHVVHDYNDDGTQRCTTCQQSQLTVIHFAHDFEADTDDPLHCAECGERYASAVHHYSEAAG